MDTLEEQVSRCLILRPLVATRIAFNPKMPRPKSFSSLEEAEAFHKEHLQLSGELKIARENQKEQKEELDNLQKDIIRQIPVSNTWIRLQVDGKEMAIGKRIDAWGGDHTVLDIQNWREDLHELVDTRHYN